MRIARIYTDSKIAYVVQKGGQWCEVADIYAKPLALTGRVFHTPVRFAAPVEPQIVFGMLHNGTPADRTVPPQAFQKSVRSVSGHEDQILLDPNIGQVKGEGELALVVGRTCRFITAEQAPDFVLGWTIGNDVTNVDQSALDSTFNQAKGGDGYTPLGPWLETELDPLHAAIQVYIDGVQVLESSTANLARNPYEVLAYLSQHFTLGPGDVILTGAPGTAWPIESGQRMSVTIPAIGTLTNKAAPHPKAGAATPGS